MKVLEPLILMGGFSYVYRYGTMVSDWSKNGHVHFE